MKIPKPRKLPSGNWFIQLRLSGESVPVTALTEKECINRAQLIKAEYKAETRLQRAKGITLRQAVDKYISSRDKILSPSTLCSYRSMRDYRFADVMDKPIKDIKEWQAICNKESGICSAKTLKNAWLFIVSVLKEQNINVPKVKLPQVIKNERPYLEPEQIPIFIKAIEGELCEIPALLALHSLRRSEIFALTWDDVDKKGRCIWVRGAAVYGDNHELIYKRTTKNESSNRYVPIMINRLYDLFENCNNKSGLLIDDTPKKVYYNINEICAKNNFPKIGLHGLRHSFASLAYHLKVPEMYAMQIGGWSDYGTMRKIYTHLAQKDAIKSQYTMSEFFNNANENF